MSVEEQARRESLPDRRSLSDSRLLEAIFAGLDEAVRAGLAREDPASTTGDVWAGLVEALPSARRQHKFAAATRRVLDVAFAAILITIFAPLIGALAVLIRLEDGGSALFAHERVTRGGRAFRCWKLRTMRTDTVSELLEDAGAWAAYVEDDFKVRDASDPRITRIGRLLRASYLDELPQLWNVIRGDMSLVGPRPIVESELAWYGPLAGELLSVRPGISGAWQLTDHVAYPERTFVELAYVRRRSVALDLRIIVLTVFTLLTRRDALIRDVLPPAAQERVPTVTKELVAESALGSLAADG